MAGIVAANLPARGYDEVGTADPRVSPGLARTNGWRLFYNSQCYVKTGTANTDWELLAQGALSGGLLTRNFFRQRAAALAGLGRGGELFDDFSTANITSATAVLPAGWNNYNKTGTGTITLPEPCVWRGDTGATAGSCADSYRYGPFLKNAKTQSWYFATRFRIPTTVSGGTEKLCIGPAENGAGNAINIGYTGAINATNYTVVYDTLAGGTQIDTGVAVDGAWHYCEMWNNPSDSRLRVVFDLGATLTAAGAQTSPTNDLSQIFRTIRNGTTAASRQLDSGWIFACFPHV